MFVFCLGITSAGGEEAKGRHQKKNNEVWKSALPASAIFLDNIAQNISFHLLLKVTMQHMEAFEWDDFLAEN